jgi:hypothetical protein
MTKILLTLWCAMAVPPALALAQTGSREDPGPPKPAASKRTSNPTPNTDAQPVDRSSAEATLDLLRRMQRARDSSAPTPAR